MCNYSIEFSFKPTERSPVLKNIKNGLKRKAIMILLDFSEQD